MKILDVPQSGHLGAYVSFKTKHGQSRRTYIVPRNPRSPAQVFVRSLFAQASARWSALTDVQRAAWSAAAASVHSHGRLGDRGVLSGFQLFMKINTNLAHLGEPWVDEPPSFPRFKDSPVGDLSITTKAGAAVLKLAVPSAPKHVTLVSATSPTSPGRKSPRRFGFLGLLPAPSAGSSDITQLYVAKFGPVPPNTRIFVQTVQQLDGWQDRPKQSTAVVPAA